jgi:ADP-heptose:LPS heptosyltransferase/glycosyltransferase involved in cell wall biosynthesis/tetratricopeptide (TPR) repeat protein
MLVGKVDRIEGEMLVGRLWHSHPPGEKVGFSIYINGVPAGHFVIEVEATKRTSGPADHSSDFSVRVDHALLSRPRNIFEIVGSSAVVAKPAKAPSRQPQLRKAAAQDEASSMSPPAAEVATDTTERPAAEVPAPSKRVTPRVPAALTKLVSASGVATEEDLVAKKDLITGLLSQLIAAGAFQQAAVTPIIEKLFKDEQWQLVQLVFEALPAELRKASNILVWYARSLIYSNRHDKALDVLQQVARQDPKKHGQIFYLGIVHAKLGQWPEAAEIFRKCLGFNDQEAKYHHELARVLVQIGFGSYGANPEDRSVLREAAEHFRRAIELGKKNSRACRELAQLMMHFGDSDSAITLAKTGADLAASDANAHADLARTLIHANRFSEAHVASARALALSPNADGIKFTHRLLSRMIERQSNRDTPTLEVVSFRPTRRPEQTIGEVSWRTRAKDERLTDILTQSTAEWLCFDPSLGDGPISLADVFPRLAFPWAGGIRTRTGEPVMLYRHAFLTQLLEAGIIAPDDSLATIEAQVARFGQIACLEPPPSVTNLPMFRRGRGVLMVSQFGIQKFGGAEHFLEQMAHLYKALGFEPVIVGTRPEMEGRTGVERGINFAFIDGSAEALLNLALDLDATIVHVVSGLGFEVAGTFRFTDIRVVFGVHFWRETFKHPTPSAGYFPDLDRQSEKRPEFHALLQDVDGIYCNSHYSAREVERNFGVRTPVIYSLPDDLDASASVEKPTPDDRNCVLLANARYDKGFGLFVDVALRVPDITFKAIVSQSGEVAARRLVEQAGANNVELISRVDDMTTLYRSAKVVAVPSYKFIETFSRVVIEAHRFGVPVIGSDRGNVPHLLTESGVALPEDADAWAAEIRRLIDDRSYWQSRSERALENSKRYAFSMQLGRLSRLVSGLASPVLVGTGSGLGNIIHTTPVIRNIAKRLGRPVDVVVAGDYEDLLFVLANREYVNHVFMAGSDVASRRYDAVFLTHSFGSVPLNFASSHIMDSRRWANFHADHELHEAEFNLAAAEALLNVPYDSDDVNGYFLGNIQYELPKETLVGLHAGSKGGIWASKRWPYYSELAKRLQRKGYKVASFGTSDEYVDGTIDLTGGTIEEMAHKMLACSHFVANDSGVMNVANALGIPLVSLFAPTNVRTRGPLMPTSQAITITKDCSPCECHPQMRKTKFATGTCNCIGEIRVADVIGAMGL